MTLARQVAVNVTLRSIRRRRFPGSQLFFRLPYLLLKSAVLLPIAALQALHGVQIHRAEPPEPAPPFRGTSTLSGRPLRTFRDSLSDLDHETDPR